MVGSQIQATRQAQSRQSHSRVTTGGRLFSNLDIGAGTDFFGRHIFCASAHLINFCWIFYSLASVNFRFQFPVTWFKACFFIFLAPPKVDLSGLGGREIRVRAGEPLKIDIPISGAPTPTVTWKKDGKDLPESNRV